MLIGVPPGLKKREHPGITSPSLPPSIGDGLARAPVVLVKLKTGAVR